MSIKNMEDILEEKKAHESRMSSYGQEVRDYIEDYGNDNSDYLIHRRLMESYHRGAYNALVNLV